MKPQRDTGTQNTPLRLVLTVQEAAAALALSRAQLYRLMGTGGLRSFREGRRRLVPLVALEDYIARRLAAEQGKEGDFA